MRPVSTIPHAPRHSRESGDLTRPPTAVPSPAAFAASCYKMRIGMDAGSGLVRGVEFTPANVADTDVADALIIGDEEAVYADKAYESRERRERLRAQG